MKFACHRLLFRPSVFKGSLGDIIELVSSVGFEGIEVGFEEIQNSVWSPQRFAGALEKYKISLSSSYWGGPFYDPSQHQKLVEEARSVAKMLQRLGCRHLLIVPPSRNQLGDFDKAAKQKYIKSMAQCLNRIGGNLKDYDVQIGVHNYWGDLVEDRRGIGLLMEATDPDFVGFAPDTGHLGIIGCDVIETFETYRDRINLVHLKDISEPGLPVPLSDDWSVRGRDLGEGDIDFVALMRILKEAGYNDWCVYEQDFGTTPVESAIKAKTYIDRFLRPIFQEK